ncbi:hypothetical protein ACIQC7_18645 [Kitasatospora sp. NPDC088556]|uniref:hypothetical protein n=1 Tax=Kitasatospora sp. NPDC088556 TaxID=3364076 RepID=UPI0037F4A7C8
MDETKSDGTPRPQARRFVIGNSAPQGPRTHTSWHLEREVVRLSPDLGSSRVKGAGNWGRSPGAGQPQGCTPKGDA